MDIKLAMERELMNDIVKGEENFVKKHSLAVSLKNKFFLDCILPRYKLGEKAV